MARAKRLIRYSNADKADAVIAELKKPGSEHRSNREIADLVGVHNTTVRKWRLVLGLEPYVGPHSRAHNRDRIRKRRVRQATT